MSTNYTYYREIYDVNGLYIYIKATLSTISGITYDSGTITTTFPSALSGGDKTILDGLIISYSNPQVLISTNQFRQISTGNSTTTTLSGNASFTGSFEDVSDYSSMTCTIYSNVASATSGLVLQFSTDGTNVDYTQSYTVPANGDVHVVSAFARYFRVIYTNGSSAQSSMRLQVIYHYYKEPKVISTVQSNIIGTSDAAVTKAVLVGKQYTNGPYTNVVLNNLNELSIDVPRTAFNELSVAQITPVVQYDFTYGLNTNVVNTFVTGSGAVIQDGTVFVSVASGAATSSSGSLLSRRVLRYKPGQGARAVFSAVYTTGVSGNTQVCGIGTDLDGYFIGYNGTAFSILRRSNGTDNWYPQSVWSIDKMDGTGSSAMVLDPTKGNIFMITYQWYGFGSQNWYVSDPNTGRFILIHRIGYENQFSVTSTLNNVLPIYYKSANTTNNTNIIIKSSSFAAFVEGQIRSLGPKYGIDSSKQVASTLYTPLLTIRNRATFNSKTNYIPIGVIAMSVAGNNSQPMIVSLFRNATITGASYSNIDTTNSVVEYDTSATAVSGGAQVQTMCLNVNGSINFDLTGSDVFLVPNETLTIAVKFISAGTGNIAVSLNWQEEQ